MGHTTFDIAIVGGGLAGASLALALLSLEKSRTLRIAIIEPKAFIDETSTSDLDQRTLALSHSSMRIYEALGIWQDLATTAHALQSIHVSEQGGFAATRFYAKKQKVPALGYVIALLALQKALTKKLWQHTQITWFCPNKISHWQTHADGSVLTLADSSSLLARLVVAADGAQSPMRDLLGIETKNVDYGEHALVTQLSASAIEQTAYERFTKTQTIALLPIKAGHCAVVVTGKPEYIEYLHTMGELDCLQQLQKTFGYRAGKLSDLGQRQVFPLRGVLAKQVVREGVVLVGHAAHTIHPVAAQGFNLSLRDIATLADLINEALVQGKSLSDPSILEDYQQWRRADQGTIIGLTHFLTHIFRYDFGPVNHLRQLGMLTCDMCLPLKNAFARRMMGTANRLPSLACGIVP